MNNSALVYLLEITKQSELIQDEVLYSIKMTGRKSYFSHLKLSVKSNKIKQLYFNMTHGIICPEVLYEIHFFGSDFSSS